jgi:hypothetical protein
MSLESASTISGLQASNPAGTDSQSQGYQHLQLIKSVLKLQFPGVGGAGFAIPITAHETEINFLGGVTSSIQVQLNALRSDVTALQAIKSFPTGTVMLFIQPTAPSGWTQVLTWTNHMLRVVTNTGGNSGGSMSPIINNTVPSHTHTFTTTPNNVGHIHNITMNAAPAHTHSVPVAPAAVLGASGSGGVVAGASGSNTISSSSGAFTPVGTIHNESVTHIHSGPTNTNVGAVNWSPFYVDSIVCSKI